MGIVSKPYTFTNGPGNLIDAPQVNADFDTLYSLVNGQLQAVNLRAGDGLFDSYKTIFDAQMSFPGGAAAVSYLMSEDGSGVAGGAATSSPPKSIYLDDADYAVAGKTLKGRIRAQLLTNSIAPATTITVELKALGSVGGASGTMVYTIGAGVAGASIAFASPPANTKNTGVGADFNFPADGQYVPIVSLSGVPAAGAICHALLQLQVRAV